MDNNQAQSNVQDSIKKVEEGYTSTKNYVSDSLSKFSQQVKDNVGAGSSFLNSNTIIAKFAFIVLIIIIFVILLNLGIVILSRIRSPPSNPFLINGLLNGADSRSINQDPTDRNSIPIVRSNNEDGGLEFTYSVWLFIEEIGKNGTNTVNYRNIFNKGDNNYDSVTGLAINNGPGLYIENKDKTLAQQECNLLFVMDSQKGRNEITIGNVPMKKWVCVNIRMQNTILDVYVNGIITERKVLEETPKQNYYNMQVAQNGGFAGKVSNLRYHERALNIFEIKKFLNIGPNLNADTSDSYSSGYYTYLSNLWYSDKL